MSTFNRRFFFVATAILSLTIVVQLRAAQAAPIHIVGSGSQYGTIDSDTGAYTSLGRLTDSVTGSSILVSGAAFGADGNLYGVTGVDGPGANGEGNYLWRFNPASGVSTDRRDLAVSFVSIARRPSDGLLFGYANDANGNGSFYRLDLATNAATFVGISDVLSFGAVTFDDENRLYMADSLTGDLYRIDTTTGAPTLFARTGVANVTGMAVVANRLQFFSTDNKGRYSADLSTGTIAFLGNYNIGGNAGSDLIYGAMLASVPEWGSGALLPLAALPLLHLRRKVSA